MKHTEGPWRVVHYAWRDKGGGDFVGRIEGANGEKVYGGAASFHAINKLANARLIAAAPEMLAANEQTRDLIEELRGGAPSTADFDCLYEIVIAAIAKATGTD